MKYNTKQQGEAFQLLTSLPENTATLAFFDPQYEPSRQVSRIKNYPLVYQSDYQISRILEQIARILKPSSFCLLWTNKNIITTGKFLTWLQPISSLKITDFLIWNKSHFGFGSYFRQQTEFAFLLQKYPTNSKCFKNRSFGNIWTESTLPPNKRKHPHQKPKGLIRTIIEATTNQGDLIIDPCAGSFVVLDACLELGREFIGCDLTYREMKAFKAKHPHSGEICLNCWGVIS